MPLNSDDPRFMFLRLKRGFVGETQRVTHVVVLDDGGVELPDVVKACCGLTFDRADADEIPPTMTSQSCYGCLLIAPFPFMKAIPQ